MKVQGYIFSIFLGGGGAKIRSIGWRLGKKYDDLLRKKTQIQEGRGVKTGKKGKFPLY